MVKKVLTSFLMFLFLSTTVALAAPPAKDEQGNCPPNTVKQKNECVEKAPPANISGDGDVCPEGYVYLESWGLCMYAY